MHNDRDHYATYYANKLWNLLPAVYRAQDTEALDRRGPLRELIDRIGGQAAILRRSIDRLWADQFIETCDDWLIPYIGELLATRLVASLDARGQRLDVAKTIYYRRRAGTVAILEEIAQDITGWESKVVEFFRRLSRTRHVLDPPLLLPDSLAGNDLLEAQGLIGTHTRTPMGGLADLRNLYGASKTHSAFDEFCYTVDCRRGAGQVGWHNIPKLGVFLWRLYSFGAGIPPDPDTHPPSFVGVTPVQYHDQPDRFTFDPTGREIPLFAADACLLGDRWVSPEEWQLPTPISFQLLAAQLLNLYAQQSSTQTTYNSLGVFDPEGTLIPATQIETSPQHWQDASTKAALLGLWVNWYQTGLGDPAVDPQLVTQWRVSLAYYLLSVKSFWIDPKRGRLIIIEPHPINLFVTYHYGSAAPIGAGAFDRRLLRQHVTLPDHAPYYPKVQGGGEALTLPRGEPPRTPLAEVIPNGTLTLADSRTYTTIADLDGIEHVTLRADNRTRPLIRQTPDSTGHLPEWIFIAADNPNADNSNADNSNQEHSRELVLDGLFLSGIHIVLRGTFDTVILTNCTFDPGQVDNSASATSLYANSADGFPLRPCQIWVEGSVKQFTIARCILGPIRTRDEGAIAHLVVTDSILQAIKTDQLGFLNPTSFALKLKHRVDLLSEYLAEHLSESTRQNLMTYDGIAPPSLAFQQQLLADLNTILATPLYDEQRFRHVQLNAVTQQVLTQPAAAEDVPYLNQFLLKDAYPELKDTAIAMASGDTVLNRCTLLGTAALHRLQANECIFNDLVNVTDSQQGCVRFSGWATGSTLPVRRYESVEIAANAPLFTSQIFGQPGYAQLRSEVDREIVSGEPGATISAGAQDGSEMGAFAGEKNPIKERSLRLKYQEYMPLGLTPVIIHVT